MTLANQDPGPDPDPGLGPDPNENVETFNVTDNSTASWWWGEADLTVNWNLTGDYEDVTVTVTNLDTNETVREFSGSSGNETYTDYSAYDNTLEIRLEATTTDGRSLCQRYVGPADGTNNFEFENCGEANIAVSSFSVPDPDDEKLFTTTVVVNESIEPVVNLFNNGSAEGTYTAALTVNNSVVATKTVTLSPYNEIAITFNKTFAETGWYAISLDSYERSESIMVHPKIAPENIAVLTNEITEGDNVKALIPVDNYGSVEDTQKIKLTSNGDVIATKTVTLGPNEEITLEFNEVFDEAGTYDISAKWLDASIERTVKEDGPEFSVTDASLSTTEIEAGDPVNTTATIENSGVDEGTYTAALTVDGSVVATKNVSVAADSSETVTFTRSFETNGTYTLGIGNTTAGTLTVGNPMIEIRTDNISVNKSTVAPDERFEITATFTNVGNRSGEVGIDFAHEVLSTNSVGEEPWMPTYPQVMVQLNESETKTVSGVTWYNETGTHEITPALHYQNANATFVSTENATISVNDSAGDAAPKLAQFEVTDQSVSDWYSSEAQFGIDWEVIHDENALESVSVTVTNLDESITRETYTGASGSQMYYDSGGFWSNEYDDEFRIRIEAVDDNGDTICQEYVGPADGDSSNLQQQSCSTGYSQTADETADNADDSDEDSATDTARSVSAVGLAGAVA